MDSTKQEINPEEWLKMFNFMNFDRTFLTHKVHKASRSTMEKYILVILLIFCLGSSPVNGKYCTSLKSRQKVETKTTQEICTQAYQAACGWFSSEMCTYYERFQCEKKFNETKTYYTIVRECCPGYTLMPNKTCMRSALPSTGADEDDDEVDISHGVFAGIGCGAVFIICVTILIVVHIKKNEKKKIIMNQGTVGMRHEQDKMIVTVNTKDKSDKNEAATRMT
ncbi:hypothetical protein SNE40_003730 [Patella caerulea]|uniref:Uncharacterized protein n=1 Tax=Patella caerulea TaxID=87958 RepID=A0AAN8KAF2_PATCE